MESLEARRVLSADVALAEAVASVDVLEQAIEADATAIEQVDAFTAAVAKFDEIVRQDNLDVEAALTVFGDLLLTEQSVAETATVDGQLVRTAATASAGLGDAGTLVMAAVPGQHHDPGGGGGGEEGGGSEGEGGGGEEPTTQPSEHHPNDVTGDGRFTLVDVFYGFADSIRGDLDPAGQATLDNWKEAFRRIEDQFDDFDGMPEDPDEDG